MVILRCWFGGPHKCGSRGRAGDGEQLASPLGGGQGHHGVGLRFEGLRTYCWRLAHGAGPVAAAGHFHADEGLLEIVASRCPRVSRRDGIERIGGDRIDRLGGLIHGAQRFRPSTLLSLVVLSRLPLTSCLPSLV